MLYMMEFKTNSTPNKATEEPNRSVGPSNKLELHYVVVD
jgi:hypothetical protein